MNNNTGVLTGRLMKHILRSPDTIITVAITPIAMMLMFVYVFGGAVKTSLGADVNYINYQLPGILLIAIASGIAYTAYRLFLDTQKGLFTRFNSMPISRSSGAVESCADLSCIQHAYGGYYYPGCAYYGLPFKRGNT